MPPEEDESLKTPDPVNVTLRWKLLKEGLLHRDFTCDDPHSQDRTYQRSGPQPLRSVLTDQGSYRGSLDHKVKSHPVENSSLVVTVCRGNPTAGCVGVIPPSTHIQDPARVGCLFRNSVTPEKST